MARGRKKQDDSLTEVISTKITQKHKEVLKKNPWLKKELDKIVREHLNDYVME